MREPYPASSAARLIDPPLGQLAVGIDAAVAQKGPVRAGDIHLAQIDRHDERLFLVGAGSGENFSGSAGDEALSPEFQPLSVGPFFQAHPIAPAHVAAVCPTLAPLDE